MKVRHLRFSGIVSIVLTVAGMLRLEPTAEQLKTMYEDSQRQLQQSQDRKNQLANENDQLKARVAELEGQLRTISLQAQQAQFLRDQATAWAAFMQQYPALVERFETYVTGESGLTRSPPPAGPIAAPFFDPNWPFSAASGLGSEGI